MITMPKHYITPIITTTSPRSALRFHNITDEDNPAKSLERRLSPTRRRANQSTVQIEQRVSSDRRRSAFSAKA